MNAMELIEDYERWTQALNVWALEAWRARTEEPVESVTRRAA